MLLLECRGGGSSGSPQTSYWGSRRSHTRSFSQLKTLNHNAVSSRWSCNLLSSTGNSSLGGSKWCNVSDHVGRFVSLELLELRMIDHEKNTLETWQIKAIKSRDQCKVSIKPRIIGMLDKNINIPCMALRYLHVPSKKRRNWINNINIALVW
jgi:hypothetical protein